ncbi:MAG: hypothetical protein JRM77_05185 [Nitrososphaerota archaeon]|jgi:hypothetical protein|nr:hypothetical protein [Nitrososphaerota archaeon]
MTYIYEVGPINYFNLSEPERNAVLSGFASALQQLSAAAVFHVRLDSMSVVVGNELYSVAYRRYFLESDQPLEGFLAAMGLQEKYVRLMEVPAYPVASNLPRYVVLENGDLAKAYTITGVSSDLDVAFLARDMGEGSIIDKTDEVKLRIEPLKRDESKGVMRLHADTLQAKVTLVEIGGGRDRELSQEAVMAEEAAQSVISGAQRLFRVSCVLILREKSLDALRKKADSFYDMIMGVVTELDSPKGIQHIMVTGEGPRQLRGASLLMPTDSVLAFFPFAGLDIIEHDGIFLGTNLQTKGPIIYDLYRKSNPHAIVVGKSGQGKSMLLKSWVSRMALTYPDLAFMAFDSVNQSEYGQGADGSYERSFAGVTGAKVVRFNPSQPMGLDPLRFFGKRQAASLLAKMAGIGIDERSLRAELNEIIQSTSVSAARDVFGAKMSEELRKRVNGNLRPLNFMFDGEPQQPYMRTIFVLDDLPNDEELRGSAVVLASALAMAALKSLPIPQKKVLLIDEAWAFLATDDRGRLYFSEAMDIVSEMARTGRHYNVALVLATQYGKDLMNGQGKTVLESCATKVLLHQDAAGQGGGSDLAQQIFGLSDQERAFIERADRGFGILFTEQGRVPFYNKLTEMEYSCFTTKPDEMGQKPAAP